MSTAPRGQAQRYIQGIQRNLSRLEDLLRRLEAQSSPQAPTRERVVNWHCVFVCT